MTILTLTKLQIKEIRFSVLRAKYLLKVNPFTSIRKKCLGVFITGRIKNQKVINTALDHPLICLSDSRDSNKDYILVPTYLYYHAVRFLESGSDKINPEVNNDDKLLSLANGELKNKK